MTTLIVTSRRVYNLDHIIMIDRGREEDGHVGEAIVINYVGGGVDFITDPNDRATFESQVIEAWAAQRRKL